MDLKVMTFNVHSGINSEDVPQRDYDGIAEVIKKLNPDIVGLQEVGRHGFANFSAWETDFEPAEYLAKKLGYHFYFAPAVVFQNKYPYGNALLTKYPIKSAKTVLIPDPENKIDDGYFQTRSILVAELDNGITVLVTHFGVVKEEKQNAVQCAIELIKEIKTPVLLLGDLNMMPNDEILRPLFGVIKDVANGKNEPATWPVDEDKFVGEYEATIKNITEQKQARRKIDYIFHSNELDVKSECVIQTKASDHKPYVVEFKI